MERPVLPSTKSPWFQYPEDLDPVLRDVRDNLDVLDSDVDDIQTGDLPIALAGIEGALGAYGPLQNMRAGVVNAADEGVHPGNCHQAMQDALNAAAGGTLALPPGNYVNEVPDTPWVLPLFTNIIGANISNAFTPGIGGVVLSGGPNRTADLMVSAAIDNDPYAPPYIWAHGNQISNVDFRAGANPISGSGLRWCPGEGSGLWSVGFSGFPEGGCELQGWLAQARFYNVHTFYNRSGIWLNGDASDDGPGFIHGDCSIYGLSGDNNQWMIDVDNGSETNPNVSGGQLVVNVFGLKAECGVGHPYDYPAGHNPLVRFWNPNGAQVHLHGPWVTNVAAAANAEPNVALVQLFQNDDLDAVSGACTIAGGIVGNYHNLVVDDITGDTYPWEAGDDFFTWRRLAHLTHRGVSYLHSRAGDPLHGVQITGNDPAIYLRNPADNTTVPIMSGQGSPEGVVTATHPALYLRTDGGTNTSVYVKETGSGNTGWVAK